MKDEIREHIESDMIAEALDAYMDAKGSEIIEENPLPLPPKLERRLAHTVRREVAAQRPRSRCVRRVLLVAALLAVLLIGATAIAFYEDIQNYALEQREKYLAAGAGAHSFLSVEGLYSPSYCPAGYRTDGRLEFHDHLATITYSEIDGDGEITFQQALDDAARLVDTEHAVSITDIFIGDSAGKLIVDQNGWTEVLWGPKGNFLLMSTTASAEELVQMAESVKLVSPDEP